MASDPPLGDTNPILEDLGIDLSPRRGRQDRRDAEEDENPILKDLGISSEALGPVQRPEEPETPSARTDTTPEPEEAEEAPSPDRDELMAGVDIAADMAARPSQRIVSTKRTRRMIDRLEQAEDERETVEALAGRVVRGAAQSSTNVETRREPGPFGPLRDGRVPAPEEPPSLTKPTEKEAQRTHVNRIARKWREQDQIPVVGLNGRVEMIDTREPQSTLDQAKKGLTEGAYLLNVMSGSVIEDVGQVMGATAGRVTEADKRLWERVENYGRTLRQGAGEKVREIARQDRPEGFLNYATRVTTQMAPLAAVAMAGGGVGAAAGGGGFSAAMAGAFGPVYFSEKGFLQNELEDAGLPQGRADAWASAGAVPIALAESAFEASAAGRLTGNTFMDAARRNLVDRIVEITKSGVRGSLFEGGTEAVQDGLAIATRAAATGETPNLDESLARILEATKAGATGGGVFGTAIGGARQVQEVRAVEGAFRDAIEARRRESREVGAEQLERVLDEAEQAEPADLGELPPTDEEIPARADRLSEVPVDRSEPERVVAAATKITGVEDPFVAQTHFEAVGKARDAGIEVEGQGPDAFGVPERQGFVTSHGRFVGRQEALQIAEETGDIRESSLPGELDARDLEEQRRTEEPEPADLGALPDAEEAEAAEPAPPEEGEPFEIRQAAFRTAGGDIITTGPVHDVEQIRDPVQRQFLVDELAEGEAEAGFVTNRTDPETGEPEFLNREQAQRLSGAEQPESSFIASTEAGRPLAEGAEPAVEPSEPETRAEPEEVAPEAPEAEETLREESREDAARKPPGESAVDTEQVPEAVEVLEDNTVRVRTEDLTLQPDKYQFRTETTEEGAGPSLEGVEVWNPRFEGVITAARDPETGELTVINGHTRLIKARDVTQMVDPETGDVVEVPDGVPSVRVQVVDIQSPSEGLALGALINIAEGNATPIDAAKVFRNEEVTAEDARRFGINLDAEGQVASLGHDLAGLADALFRRVASLPEGHPDHIRERRAAIVGRSGLSDPDQVAVMQEANEQNLRDFELESLVDRVKRAGTRVVDPSEAEQTSLLEEEAFERSNFAEESKVEAHIKRELARDRRMAGAFTRAGRAERAEAKGVAQVDVERAEEVGSEAALFEETFNRLVGRQPISGIIRRAGERLANNEGSTDAILDRALGEARQAIESELEEGGLRETVGPAEGPAEVEGGPEQGVQPEESEPEPEAEADVAPAEDLTVGQLREQGRDEEADAKQAEIERKLEIAFGQGERTETTEKAVEPEEPAREGQGDFFGGPSPLEGGEQFALGVEETRGAEGITEAEKQAQQTVQRLQRVIEEGQPTTEQLREYQEAVRTLRREQAKASDEVSVDRRVESTLEDPGDVSEVTDQETDLFSRGAPESGEQSARERPGEAGFAGAPGVGRARGTEGTTHIGLLKERIGEQVDAFTSFLRRNFTGPGDLPHEVFRAKLRRDHWMKSQLLRMEFHLRDLAKAVQELDPSIKGWDDLSRTEVEVMDAALKGDVPMEELPQELQQPLSKMRNFVDNFSIKLIEEGAVQGKLVPVVAENLGAYLTRSYRVHDDPEWAETVRRDNPELYNRAISWVHRELKRHYRERNAEPRTEADLEEEAQGIIDEILVTEDGPIGHLSKMVGSKDVGILQKRKEIDPVIRAVMGEFRDPRVNFARSVNRMVDLLGNHNFLVEIAQEGRGDWLLPPEEGPRTTDERRFNVQIAGEGSEVLAPLNGWWTDENTKKALEVMGQAAPAGKFWRRYMKYLNAPVKVSKTILSMMTHVRNFVANPMFLVANGNIPFQDLGAGAEAFRVNLGTLEEAVETVRTKMGVAEQEARDDTEKAREYLARAAEVGVAGTSARANELRAVVRDATRRGPDDFMSDPTRSRLRKMLEGASRLYAAEDDFWKLVQWEQEKRKYRQALPEATEQEIEELTGEIVRNTMPTYSNVSRAVRFLRRSPAISAFPSFVSEVFRNSYHILRQTQEEIRSDNPEIRKIGWRRATGIGIAAGIVPAITATSQFLTGVGSEADEDVRRFVPPWSENSDLLYLGTDEQGNTRYVDLSYTDPFNYIRKPWIAMMRDEPWEDRLVMATSEMLQPFVGEEILGGKIASILRNKTSTGREVWNPGDTRPEQFKDIAYFIWEAFEPGTVTNANRIRMAIADEETKYGATYSEAQEIAALFSGIRFRSLDIERSLSFQASDRRQQIDDAERVLNSTVARSDEVSEEQLRDAYERTQRRRREFWMETHEDVQAAIRRGLDENHVFELLTEAGFSKSAANNVISGVYIPHAPSRQFFQRVRIQQGRTDGPEAAQTIRERQRFIESLWSEDIEGLDLSEPRPGR